jgi:hypothetical protein
MQANSIPRHSPNRVISVGNAADAGIHENNIPNNVDVRAGLLGRYRNECFNDEDVNMLRWPFEEWCGK